MASTNTDSQELTTEEKQKWAEIENSIDSIAQNFVNENKAVEYNEVSFAKALKAKIDADEELKAQIANISEALQKKYTAYTTPTGNFAASN